MLGYLKIKKKFLDLVLRYYKSMAAASLLMKNGIVVKDIIGGLSAMLIDAPELEI